MNIPLEQIGLSGGTIISALAGIVAMWFKFQNKVDNLVDKDAEQGKKIEDIIKWSHEHEKEASGYRDAFNKELSKLEGASLVINEQFKQIMAMLEDIKERMGKLEEK